MNTLRNFSMLAALVFLSSCTSSGSSDETASKAECGGKEVALSGSVEGQSDSLGYLAGVEWGKGTLRLNDGTQHEFHVKGVKLLQTGVSTGDFAGEVYNLKNVEDFIGVYYGAGHGINLIKGKGEFIVNNSKCVLVKVKSKSEGLELSAPGPEGLYVNLAD